MNFFSASLRRYLLSCAPMAMISNGGQVAKLSCCCLISIAYQNGERIIKYTVTLMMPPAVKCAGFPVSLTQWNTMSSAWALRCSDRISAGKLCRNLEVSALKMSIGATSKISVSLCFELLSSLENRNNCDWRIDQDNTSLNGTVRLGEIDWIRHVDLREIPGFLRMLLKLKNSQKRKFLAFILYLPEPITLGRSSTKNLLNHLSVHPQVLILIWPEPRLYIYTHEKFCTRRVLYIRTSVHQYTYPVDS